MGATGVLRTESGGSGATGTATKPRGPGQGLPSPSPRDSELTLTLAQPHPAVACGTSESQETSLAGDRAWQRPHPRWPLGQQWEQGAWEQSRGYIQAPLGRGEGEAGWRGRAYHLGAPPPLHEQGRGSQGLPSPPYS